MDDYGYKTNRQGFSLGYSFEQYRDIYFSPSISTYYENLKTSSKASALKKKQEGNYFEGQFLYGLTLNKLNQNFQPTDGFSTSFHQSIPLLSDDMSFKNSYRFSTFYMLPQDVLFSLRFNVDAINSLNGDDVRVSKRIFMPETRLRGFSSGKIGPKDSGEYIGGNYGSSLNLGATLPELLKDLENVDFSLFLDMANIWGVDYDSNLDSKQT
jgi:Outer membrane protein/protective antigen OMA87